MRRFLLLSSLLLALCQLSCLPLAANERTEVAAVSDSVQERTYNMLMKARGNEVTGICMMEIAPDGSIVGTIVNEFGVKAFDFTYRKGKAKVTNVLGPLNKWYIRMVLRADFAFILQNLDAKGEVTKKKRRLTVSPEGELQMDNNRYKIYYTLTPMNVAI